MLTASYPPIEFEHRVRKIKQATNSCVVLSAGDALAHTEILRKAKASIKALTEYEIKKIVEIIINSFIEKKKQIANERIFNPRGLDLDSVYGNKARILPPEYIAHVDLLIGQIDLGLNMLICGIDAEGGHIYTIKEEKSMPLFGLSQCYDSLGYGAIGSGALHALSTFIYSGYLYAFPMTKALYIAYEAKKMAENAPGVGTETDVAIITQNEIQYLDNKEIDKLNEIHDRRIIKLEEPEKDKELDYFNKFLPKKEKKK